MRVYIEGIISEPNSEIDFMLFDLWFAPEDCDDVFESEDVVYVRSGMFCSTNVDEDNKVRAEWYDAFWEDANTEADRDPANLIKALEGKRLVNAEACYNDDVDFEITKVDLGCYDFPLDRVDIPIEFIAD